MRFSNLLTWFLLLSSEGSLFDLSCKKKMLIDSPCELAWLIAAHLLAISMEFSGKFMRPRWSAFVMKLKSPERIGGHVLSLLCPPRLLHSPWTDIWTSLEFRFELFSNLTFSWSVSWDFS